MLLLERLRGAAQRAQVLEPPLSVAPRGRVGRRVPPPLMVLDESAVKHHRREHHVAERAALVHLAANRQQALAEAGHSTGGLFRADAVEFVRVGARAQEVAVVVLARASS